MNDALLQRKLTVAERRVAVLERMIEDKTRELFLANQDYAELLQVMPGALVVTDASSFIRRVNRATLEMLGYTNDELTGKTAQLVFGSLAEVARGQSVWRREMEWIDTTGKRVPVLVSTFIQRDAATGAVVSQVSIALDMRERKQLELELRHAQKLEAVGQLAAGVAHEINTPMQFIGDNVHFIGDALHGLLTLVDSYSEVFRSDSPNARKAVLEAHEAVDLDFVRRRVPRAIERTLMGVARVSNIVSALKAFSHPSEEKAPIDINKAVETTLLVAHGEYKYVAETEVALGELPPVLCSGSDLNQVLLNLVVNAAHAIGSARGDHVDAPLGKIRLETAREGNVVRVSVADTGGGIPESIRHRIFEPFFTTKQVGKGTGQGLALAHNLIVKKHGGTLHFVTELGKGTEFVLRLPIDGVPIAREAVA